MTKMRHRSVRWLAVLALLGMVTGVQAAGPAGDGPEERWNRLHRGFTRDYIDECLARQEQPDWDLEDEADLVMGYWWLMAEDYRNRLVQDQLFSAVERGISRCGGSFDERSCPPEHLALMGNLITMASQVQVVRGNYLSAARYARKGKGMLEKVRQSNPEIGDTYFSLGLYLYYVDLSSPLVRSLQRILFFPPGDARLGLFYLEKAALQSKRFGPMARVALATIYANGEGHHSHALSHLYTLRRRYPENPLFLSLTAEALSELGAFAAARDLLDEAEEKISSGEPPFLAYHRNVFKVILAELDLRDFSLDTAYDGLTGLMKENGGGPSWVRPVAAYSLARLYLLSGNDAGYSALLRRLQRADENGRHRRRIKRLPGKLADQGYGPDLHQVFRHWITGDLDTAVKRLQRLSGIRGNTGLVTYLLGELHLQRGETVNAGQRFREYLGQGADVKPLAAGWSLVRLGDIEAEGGDLDAARHYYRQAESRDDFPDRQVAVHRLEMLASEEARRRGRQAG